MKNALNDFSMSVVEIKNITINYKYDEYYVETNIKYDVH